MSDDRVATTRILAEIAKASDALAGGAVHEITADPTTEIRLENANALEAVKKTVPSSGEWTFPAASVSAIEL